MELRILFWDIRYRSMRVFPFDASQLLSMIYDPDRFIAKSPSSIVLEVGSFCHYGPSSPRRSSPHPLKRYWSFCHQLFPEMRNYASQDSRAGQIWFHSPQSCFYPFNFNARVGPPWSKPVPYGFQENTVSLA